MWGQVLRIQFLKNRNHINFVIGHISNKEILVIISLLENKSTGPSCIHLKLLLLILDLISIPLAYIINMSGLTGEYPDSLKLVKVIPIHKGGSTQDVNTNYQPISLNCCLSILPTHCHSKLHYCFK